MVCRAVDLNLSHSSGGHFNPAVSLGKKRELEGLDVEMRVSKRLKTCLEL